MRSRTVLCIEKNALDFFSLGVRTKQERRKKIESQIADRAAAKIKSHRDNGFRVRALTSKQLKKSR